MSLRVTSMTHSALATYLNDHLGLITGEIELARRVASENEGELSSFLTTYADDVIGQKDLLENAVAAVGGSPSSLKQAAGWLAEKIGRLKPNDALVGYTNLARVIEVEALISAAEARLLLWQTLEGTTVPSPQWSSSDAVHAQNATRQQLAALRDFHRTARERAFG